MVRKKKLDSWNEVLDKIFMKTGKSFGHLLVGLRRVIVRVLFSVTSTKGKLKVLQDNYERLGTASVDDQFEYNTMSRSQKDKVLDRGISYAEIKVF